MCTKLNNFSFKPCGHTLTSEFSGLRNLNESRIVCFSVSAHVAVFILS